MTSRQIRRAEERRQRKLARKSDPNLLQQSIQAPESPLDNAEPEASVISEARLAANRANAQLSTGPTSSEGKAKVSLNAVKTALTGQTVLLPTDDVAAYERHLRGYQKMLHPLGEPECDLVQSIADTAWRLRRIPALEISIYSHGHVEFASCFDQFDVSLRASLIDRHVFLTFEKQLHNLQLQEGRLQRRRDKEMAELRKLQQERDQREKIDLECAAKLYLAARHDRKPFHPAERGFEFSIADIEAYLEGVRAANIARAALDQDRNLAREALKTRSKAA